MGCERLSWFSPFGWKKNSFNIQIKALTVLGAALIENLRCYMYFISTSVVLCFQEEFHFSYIYFHKVWTTNCISLWSIAQSARTIVAFCLTVWRNRSSSSTPVCTTVQSSHVRADPGDRTWATLLKEYQVHQVMFHLNNSWNGRCGL